jgi:hypothetical protein
MLMTLSLTIFSSSCHLLSRLPFPLAPTFHTHTTSSCICYFLFHLFFFLTLYLCAHADVLLQKRRTNNKPRDTSTPAGASAADAVRNMVKKNPKYSKRINYDALAGLLSTAPGASDKDDLLRFDDKDEDGMDIVDEDAAAPPLKVPRATTEDVGKEPFSLGEDGEDEDEDVHGKDDFGGDGGWEDAFEQEA